MITVIPGTLNLIANTFSPRVWVLTAVGTPERTFTVVYQSRLTIGEGESRIINSEGNDIMLVTSAGREIDVSSESRITEA